MTASASGARPTCPRAGASSSGAPATQELVEFLRWWGGELREAGLLAPHWPKEWGGGFSVPEQVVIAEELARGDVPRNALYHVGVFNVAPTLVHSATAEQRERYLPGIWDGEVWCQGYSEPNAGSDLASLQTRAVRDGDNYVVTGQKVWTSWANEADWCMLLARTDPVRGEAQGHQLPDRRHAVAGHRGAADPAGVGPGRLQRGLLRRRRRAGREPPRPENGGWGVAQGTLAAERAVAILEMTERLRCNGIEAAVAEAAAWRLENGAPALEDGHVREMLAESYAEVHVLRHVLNQMIDDIIRGVDVSGTSSIIKVFYTELLRRLMRVSPTSRAWPGSSTTAVLACAGWETGFWMNDYIHSFGWLIGGGTNEIQRNVIGERMLGLPR